MRGRIVGGIAAKKREKRERLCEAAATLFRVRGAASTAVEDIVRRAGVAKGTFYLYFHSKADILAEVVAQKTAEVIHESLRKVEALRFPRKIDKVVGFVDELVEAMRRDVPLLELIHDNLSWILYRRFLSRSEKDDTMRDLKGRFEDLMRESGRLPDAERVLFVVTELTVALSYNAIVHKEPAGIAQMKPILLDSVRRILA
jgi:AcrR family transcriptional regulator